MHLPTWLPPDILASLIVAAVMAWVGHTVKTPKDHERAALLATLANDAAALIVALNPTAEWSHLVQQVVQRLASASTVPTANTQTIEAAAKAALVRLGKLPSDGSR
jgi:cytochrome bd-type quinol oxidase subunit 1